MRHAALFGFTAALTFAACGDGTAPGEQGSTEGTIGSQAVNGEDVLPRIEFPQVDDNIHNDTILIQVTFDMGDGSFVMVASNVDETFEGLRLYHYRFAADSTVDMMAVSPPAYDSWTMLPTFFRYPKNPGAFIILANFGEKQSWGQKVMRMDGNGFMDLGFIDVALPERIMEGDAAVLKLRNVAEVASVLAVSGGIEIGFVCDSIYLYDDQRGKYDAIIAARRFRCGIGPDPAWLEIDGDRRPIKRPA